MNLYVTSGDSYTGDRRLTVTVTDPDGSATNLTGVTLTFTAKRRRPDANEDAVISKTTTAGIEITDAPGGTARIALAEDDTAELSGQYWWELEAQDPDGTVTLAAGILDVHRGLIS